MILIGLGHKARQGKNYVASYIKDYAEDAQAAKVGLYAFADELKLYCKTNHYELMDEWCRLNPKTILPGPKDDPIYGYTQILQWYGTEIARKNDPDTWVKALAKRIETEKPDIAIITDVRFPNEAQYVKDRGGSLVEVIRLKDGEQYLDPGRDPNHASETALDDYQDWDFIISCKDGDLKGLKAKSIGVYNLVTSPEDYESYYVDEPDYSDAIMESIDSDSTGFKEFEPTVD